MKKSGSAQVPIGHVVINGIEYVRADEVAPRPSGKRAVVVVDRGWIFAGDVLEENGRIKLSHAVWLFRWQAPIGFSAVIANPHAEGVDLRPIADVDVPAGAEVFRVPVDDTWGLT